MNYCSERHCDADLNMPVKQMPGKGYVPLVGDFQGHEQAEQ
jgi:hypothetical protein